MKMTKELLAIRAQQRRRLARAHAAALYRNVVRENFVPSRASTSDLLVYCRLERRLRPIFEVARREVTRRFEHAREQRRRAFAVSK